MDSMTPQQVAIETLNADNQVCTAVMSAPGAASGPKVHAWFVVASYASTARLVSGSIAGTPTVSAATSPRRTAATTLAIAWIEW